MQQERPSWASSDGVRKSMRANRGRDTGPELALRRALHARGYRFRVNIRPEPGIRRTADVVFTRRRVAVFVDGCFWHGCPQHATRPKTNREFWTSKLDNNRARDLETNEQLRAAGWSVVRIWEHEPVEDAVRSVATEVERSKRL